MSKPGHKNVTINASTSTQSHKISMPQLGHNLELSMPQLGHNIELSMSQLGHNLKLTMS